MKLELKLPPTAKFKIMSEYNNTICIYSKDNDLEYVLVPIKKGGAHGKD